MYLGVDIGGTKCAVALATAAGEVTTRRETGTAGYAGWQPLLDWLLEASRAIVPAADEPVDGVGISYGGPVTSALGIAHAAPNLPAWVDVPLRQTFREAFPGTRVEMDNDANATALAEWRWGAGVGARNMVYATQGTGIGSGLIIEGRLYRGACDAAGEIGHQTILLDGPPCKCGKRGCLEALASGPAIARLAHEQIAYGRGKDLVALAGGRAADITAKHVVDAAKAGDRFSVTILEQAGVYMGVGLSNVIQTLNPEVIVLGTIAVHAGELILGPIRATIEERTWKRPREACRVVPAALGDRAQDLAAIALLVAQDPTSQDA